MWNLVKIGPAVSKKKTYKDYMILYMYVAQEQGQITPKGQTFDWKIENFYRFNHTLSAVYL